MKQKIISAYTKPFFELAQESSLIEEVGEELDCLNQLFVKHPEQFRFFISSVEDSDLQYKLMKDILVRFKFQNITRNLVLLVLKNKRFNLFFEIKSFFFHLKSLNQNILEGEVFGTQELLSDEHEQITQFLEKKFNSKVKLNYFEDKTLLGGLTIKIAGHTLNGSMVDSLDQMETQVLKSCQTAITKTT